ncbi:unnamed protein product, partial [Lymnaea stagnalis]
ELKLEHNQLAAFIAMLRDVLKGKTVNKDNFVRTLCASTLQNIKLTQSCLSVTTVTTVRFIYLIEDCDDTPSVKSTLLQHIYHYILFDFSL